MVNMDSKEFDSKYIVTTYASLIKNLKNGELRPGDYSFVILDEAHKALGTETSEAIRQFSDAVKIGFTATPEYTIEKSVSQLLDHEIYRMNVDEAIRAGMLSNARTVIVKTGIDLSSVPIKNGEYVVNELEQKLNVVARNRAAVDYYKQKFMGKQGVAYCIKISHAESVKKLFVEAGVEAEVISGENTKEEKKNILERYKKGEIKVLCNADILIEGFDHDKAAVCLNLRPTMSAVIAEQRGGRVLRLDSEDPDKIGYVIDFLDDNQAALSQSRPTPILYREVLGAMAVPRAVASESDPTRSEKGTADGGDAGNYSHIDLKVISTEEQFEDILQQKEGYKQAVILKEEEKKQKTESREKARQLYKDYVRIKPEFDIITDKTQMIISFISETDKNNAPWKLSNELGDIRRDFYKTMKQLYRYSMSGSGEIELPTAGKLKEKIDALYYGLDKNLKDENMRFSREEKSEAEKVLFINQNLEKISLGNSEETGNWLTKRDMKDRGRSHGEASARSLWGEKINELEREREEWVALRDVGNGNFARIYSPRFLEEIEHRVFQASYHNEMLVRGSEAEVGGWKTEQDMHDFVGNLDLETELVSSIIRTIERNHHQWIALRESVSGKSEYVYSPEFFDEFETKTLNEVVEREARNK